MLTAGPVVWALELPFPRVDPVVVDLPGPLDVRWYGLMYLAGFAAAYAILGWLARRGVLRLAPKAIGDLVATLALGVILGGRIGYLLFYDLAAVRAHPLDALRVWEGGMSFHGGLLGVLAAAAWYARRHRLSLSNLGDALALATPFGLFAVRLANFVNGELYGRLASSGVSWGVRFPTDPVARRLLGTEGLGLRESERRLLAAYRSGLWDAVRTQVPLRHPSQLYEALGEGVLLGAVLWSTFLWRRRGRPQAVERAADPADRAAASTDGLYAGLFLVGYGVVRVVVEQFRQPDAQFRGPGNPLGTVLGPLTMGQVLSSGMIVAGLALVAWTVRRTRRGTASGHAAQPTTESHRT